MAVEFRHSKNGSKIILCFLNLLELQNRNECGIGGSFNFTPTYIYIVKLEKWSKTE